MKYQDRIFTSIFVIIQIEKKRAVLLVESSTKNIQLEKDWATARFKATSLLNSTSLKSRNFS